MPRRSKTVEPKPNREAALASAICYARMRRLKVGEEIKPGDWCCAPNCDLVLVLEGGVKMSATHHPHYRLTIAAHNDKLSNPARIKIK